MLETPPQFPQDQPQWWRKIWPKNATPKYKIIVVAVGIFGILLAITAGVVAAKIINKKEAPAPVAEQKMPEGETPDSSSSEEENKTPGATPENKPANSPNQPGGNSQTTPGGAGGTAGESTTGGNTGGNGNTGGDGGTPDPAPSCALPNYPNETCTGVPAGTVLTIINGDLEIKTAGTVVDGKDIRGCVIVQAPNVTIRNSKITCTSFYGVASYQSSDEGGLLIEDVEVDCANHNSTGISFQGMIARRVHIHGCENGLDILSDVVLEDSYIHGIYEGASGHGDGIQSPNGSNSSIIHNTIYAESTTAAININHSSSGPTTSNVLIKDNLLAGGAYTLYCPLVATVNFRVVNNHFSRIFHPNSGAFGTSTDCTNEAEFSGNIWHDTGLPVAAQ